jgi:hypothetical protein
MNELDPPMSSITDYIVAIHKVIEEITKIRA